MTRLFCGILWLAAAACCFFGVVPPLFYRIMNLGVVALLLLAAACAALALLLCMPERRPWEVFAGQGGGAIVWRRVLSVLLALFVVLQLPISAVMYQKGWHNRPAPGSTATAVVLGAQVRKGQPTLMLQRRLEVALQYLQANPDAKVVVTGGLDPVEQELESAVQAAWLTDRGIDPARILQETQSHDTAENLQFTAALLSENGLPPQVVVFSDGFHLLRAQLFAMASGLTPTAVPSNTPWGLVPCYWLREQLALVEALLLYPGTAQALSALL